MFHSIAGIFLVSIHFTRHHEVPLKMRTDKYQRVTGSADDPRPRVGSVRSQLHANISAHHLDLSGAIMVLLTHGWRLLYQGTEKETTMAKRLTPELLTFLGVRLDPQCPPTTCLRP
jgi:hypothetical protein